MIGPSRSSPKSSSSLSRMAPGEDGAESPPPAPDVTADPRVGRNSCHRPSSPSESRRVSDKEVLCNTSGGYSHPMHRTSHSSSGSSAPTVETCGGRNNEVRSVMLYGIPIVALVIDSQERLCLAQISNTLLKEFSYNEIHNRRVALGITCVQCTPVQLELLRRAGAMPVSSRRCGMITKREAERLCKSFLADTTPPKLPDNFAFDVYHQCAWGCRGSFVPSRYNSSRAKCLKCAYCGLFFSPNKFIFHSHRLPESKYVQPDAANFNSWRRHIKLSGTPPDDVMFAWEDVKAMFNGGSRKRVLAASLNSFSRNQELKRHRMNAAAAAASVVTAQESVVDLQSNSGRDLSLGKPLFPLVPLPNKNFSMSSTTASLIPPPTSFALSKAISPTDIRQNFAEYMWAGKHPFPLPYGAVLWPRPPPGLCPAGLSPPGMSPSAISPPGLSPHMEGSSEDRTNDSVSSGNVFRVGETSSASSTPREVHRRPLSSSSDGTPTLLRDEEAVGFGETAHPSAFRPVGRIIPGRVNCESPVASTSVGPSSRASIDGGLGEDFGDGDGAERGGGEDSEPENSDHDEVDVTDVSSESGDDLPRKSVKAKELRQSLVSVGGGESSTRTDSPSGSLQSASLPRKDLDGAENRDEIPTPQAHDMGIVPWLPAAVDVQKLSSLTKDELHEVLLQEAQARRKAEVEFQIMRETFEEQVKKEISYREGIAKQLQFVREAHYALQHFSCKLSNTRPCAKLLDKSDTL